MTADSASGADEIARHIETRDTFGRHLGIRIVEARPGYAKAVMPMDERHKNGVGLAHGGAIFGLADIAFAAASNADLGNAVLNVASSISYMKAGKTGPLTAEANAVTSGRRLVTYEVRVMDGGGQLLAVCQITGYRTDAPLLP